MLDWLEAHHVPVYKIVDPLEKRGIPSLPVFVAFLLILIYLIFSLVGGGLGDGGGGVTSNFQLEDAGTGDCVADAHLKFTNSETYETDIGSDCKANVNLPSGEYTLEISKEGCENVTTQVTLAEGASNMASVSLVCGDPADQVSLCFDPPTVGTVAVVKLKNDLYQGRINDCGDDECIFYVESGLTYEFETSHDYESEERYGAEDLREYSEEGTCIPMRGFGVVEPETGRVMVEVRDASGNLVPLVRVKLVNPQDVNGVIATQITGYNGSSLGTAYFEEEIGTLFKVKIEAGNSTGAYMGTQAYNFTDEPQTIKITLAQSLTTRITVLDKATRNGVGNVLVTLFEQPETSGQVNSTYTFTSPDGNASVGLRAGYSYRITFWRIGYLYTEGTINAGDQKTFEIEKVNEEQVGAIDVSIYFENDGPVEGAIPILEKDGEAMGIPTEKTGLDGLTSLENIPPGEYCITVSRTNALPTDCEDNPVTVVGGKRTGKEIEIGQVKWNLVVSVTMGGIAVRNATVTVKESFGAFTLTNITNTFGKATFGVLETNNGVEIAVFYKAGNGEVFNVVQYMPKITDDMQTRVWLVPSGNAVELLGAEDLSGSALDISTATFEAGKTYRFIFSIGIWNIQGSKPETVKFTLQDTKGLIEFLPEETFDWLTLSPTIPSQMMEYTAEGDFQYDRTVQIKVPVRVKQVFNGTRYHNFSFKGYWEKDPVVIMDPAGGGYKNTSVLKLQAGFCRQYGDFGVCKYLLFGDTQKDPQTFTAVLLDQFNIGIEITNEGPAYSGQFEVNDSKLSVLFGEATIQRIAGSTTTMLDKYVNYLLNEHKITVNYPTAVTLDHGDVLKIIVPVKVVSPPRSAISSQAGSQDLGNISFKITGLVEPQIQYSLEPTITDDEGVVHIYDLTGDMPFKFVEKENGVDIAKYRIWSDTTVVSRVGGSGLTCTTINLRDSVRSVDKIFNTPNFYVAFDEGCRINAGGELKIELADMEEIKDASWSLDTEACLKFPSKSEMFTTMMSDQACDVEYIFSPDGPRVQQPAGGICTPSAPTEVYVRTCEELVPSVDIDPFVTSQLMYDRQVADASASGTTVTFSYKGTLIGDSIDEVNLSTDVIARSEVEYTGIQLSSTYTLPNMTFTVKKGTETGPICEAGDLFQVQKIQKYEQTVNCYESFCNIEQALNYIKAETLDFSPDTSRFKLVNQQLTPQIISLVWEEIFPDLAVTVSNKAYTGSERYVIDSNTLNVPRKGFNVAKLEAFTTNIEHIFITFTNEPDPSLDKIDYVQLDMLNQENFADNDKLKTRVTIDLQTVPSEKQEEVKTALQSIIEDSWNLGYIEPPGATSLIVAEICQIDLLPAPQVCLNMREANGNTNLSIIYKDVSTAGTTIHFAANGTQQLLDLIKGFSDAINNPSTVGILMSNLEKTYLTIAPPECSQQAPPGVTLCTPGSMDIVLLGDGFVEIYDYGSITDDIKSDTLKVRLGSSYLTGAINGKIADILGSPNRLFDGKSEIIALVKTADEDARYRIVVLQDNDGSAVPNADYYTWPVVAYYDLDTYDDEVYKDFAVIDWNGDNKADLAVLERDEGNNKIDIINNSYLIDYVNRSVLPYIGIDIDDNEDISMLKAFQKDGYQMIVITERGTADDDNNFVYIIKNTTDLVKPGTYVDASKGLYRWFQFHRECTDSEIVGNSIYGCLVKAGPRSNLNDVYLFSIDGLADNNIVYLLDKDCPVPCSAWIDVEDESSYDLYSADLDASGSIELIVGDLKTPKSGGPSDEDCPIGESCDSYDIETYGKGSEGTYTKLKHITLPREYVDIAAFDWQTNCGPRVA